MKCPYVEDVHDVGDAEVAIFGAPLDAGTTYRPGTRFGPQGIRRATNLFGTYNFEMGVDLREQLNLVDIGDVCAIPGNLEKSFDQISKAMSHVVSSGVFPVVLGGDHSIGYPTIRGLAPHMDGNVGIIHFDRHVDTQELDLDERMHTTPWFHATNIKNAPPTNLVQIGIGGWQAPRAGVKVGRGRGTTIMTVGDVERVGIEKIAETALGAGLAGRLRRLPVVRHRRDRLRLRARYRLARARWSAAPRGAGPGQAGLRGRHLRHGGGRVLPAVRLVGADLPDLRPGDPRLAGHHGRGSASSARRPPPNARTPGVPTQRRDCYRRHCFGRWNGA